MKITIDIMHELSIAQNILEIVQSISEKEKMEQVHVVHLQLGRLSSIDPEALQWAYQTLTEETALAGSTLSIEEIAAQGRCRECGHLFDFPENFFCSCPLCTSSKIDILKGRELLIDSLEGELLE